MNSLFRWLSGVKNKTSCILFVIVINWRSVVYTKLWIQMYYTHIELLHVMVTSIIISFVKAFVNTMERKRRKENSILLDYYYFILLYSWGRRKRRWWRGAVMRNWLKRYKKEHINICADWDRMFEMGSKQQSNSSEAFDVQRIVLCTHTNSRLHYAKLKIMVLYTLDEFSPK